MFIMWFVVCEAESYMIQEMQLYVYVERGEIKFFESEHIQIICAALNDLVD